MVKGFLSFLLCFFFVSGFCDETNTSPPQELPIVVEVNFSLLNLENIHEKEETFTVDAYFIFKWEDPRLIFSPEQGQTVKVYLEDSATGQLSKIWWPQIEFVNSANVIYNNRALFIFPNGKVEYYISITGDFRTHLDLSRFPFDRQPLRIMVDSFLWNSDVLLFRIPGKINELDEAHGIHDELGIIKIKESIILTEGLNVSQLGNTNEYSTFMVTITTKRVSGFYIFQVFIPLILVFGISCTVFFSYKEPFLDRIMLSLTSLLVFLAAKFTINQDLPQIGYMTIIDKAFLAAYICLGLSVIASVVEKVVGDTDPERALKIEKHVRWIVPLLFILAVLWIFHQKTPTMR
jgi:hypothetical protein